MRANILLKHISIEGFLFHSLRLLLLFLNFSQLTNSLACICQLHKIRTSHCLALYSFCRTDISWMIHRSVGKQQETLSPCFSIPPFPSSAAEQCHWADTCAREQHKKNSARGSFLKSNFFFPHEKSLTMSF